MYLQLARPVEETVLPESRYLALLKNRIRNKFSSTVVYTGVETGIGKSDYALQAGIGLDPTFQVKRTDGLGGGVLFNLDPFFEWVYREAEEDFSGNVLPVGSVLHLDEAGVDLDNAEWMKQFHKAYKYIAETFRFMRIHTSLSLPNIGMLDVNQRRVLTGMMHIEYRGRGVFYKLKNTHMGELRPVPQMVVDAQPIPENHPLRFQYELQKKQDFKTLARNVFFEAREARLGSPGMYGEAPDPFQEEVRSRGLKTRKIIEELDKIAKRFDPGPEEVNQDD